MPNEHRISVNPAWETPQGENVFKHTYAQKIRTIHTVDSLSCGKGAIQAVTGKHESLTSSEIR